VIARIIFKINSPQLSINERSEASFRPRGYFENACATKMLLVDNIQQVEDDIDMGEHGQYANDYINSQ